MDTYFFDQKHSNFNFDMEANFFALINEYKKQGQPVVLFKRPILKNSAEYSSPILTYDHIEKIVYAFYGNGFKAIFCASSSVCDLAKFEEEKLKDITLIDYSTMRDE